MKPRFYFSICQIGAEKAVKSEILNEFPHLRFAFNRPGFITFKQDSNLERVIDDTHSIFTRVWGESIGQVKDEASLVTLLKEIPAKAVVHRFDRDLYVPGDEPEDFQFNHRIDSLVTRLQIELPELKQIRWNETPKVDEYVYDLIWLDDFHVFLGRHLHHEHMDPAAGNRPDIKLPKESPSRAYLKIVEAIHRFELEPKSGMSVVEVGCSPGGATTAMLSKGMKVIGIDPKRMDQKLYQNQNFKFIQKTAGSVQAIELREVNPDWIVMDMNIAPLEAIDELTHVINCLKTNNKSSLKLKYGLLTIKLNDWKFAESIPLYMRRLEEAGFRDCVATQLCSNRQEFFVFARFE